MLLVSLQAFNGEKINCFMYKRLVCSLFFIKRYYDDKAFLRAYGSGKKEPKHSSVLDTLVLHSAEIQ